jgi:flagellar hook-associated protein 1 FlgK
MSLLTAISHSLTGLRAIQADMQVISSNVSNAGRADYTRKNIILSSNTAGAQGTGGVSVTGYGRAENASLDKLLRLSLADAGLRNSQSDYLNRVQTILGSSQDEPLLTTAMSALAAAWRAMAAAPEDSTRKQDVIFKAQNLAREVNRIADSLDKLKSDLRSDMATATDTLNTSLTRIQDLNNQIVSAGAAGQSVVDLMDLRDVEVHKVAELVKINVYQRDQGRISIYTPGGSALLDAKATQFAWNGTNFTINPGGADASAIISGGKIEGYLGMLDQGTSPATINDPGKATIYKLEQQLNGLVDLFTNPAGTFATAYDDAATGTGELADSFFTGSSRYTFAVNSDLLDGTSTLKQEAAVDVAADMDIDTRSVSLTGLTLTNASYTSFTDGIIYTHNQNVQHVTNLAAVYTAQQEDYTKRLQDATGVNVDTEIVRLTQLQNNYSAISRVIATAQAMLEMLDRIGGG